MAVDPTTGLYSLDVNYQPTGAMGAVISLLNSQKANEIASTLQQQREAQASLESQQAEQYGLAKQREQKIRDVMAQLPEGASSDVIADTLVRNGEDPKLLMPYLRTAKAAQGKSEAAGITATGRENVAGINQGLGVTSVSGQELPPAPLPTAKAGLAGALGEKATAQADQTNALTAPKVAELGAQTDALKALADLRKAQAAVAKLKQAATGKASLGDPELAQANKTITAVNAEIGKYQRALLNKYYTAEEAPSIAAEIKRLEAMRDDAVRVVKSKASAGGASGGSSMFAPGTFDTNTGGGVTPAAPGTSSPGQPVSKTLVFPP